MGLPGLRGTEHIGFTVPDLDEAHRFFVDVIGWDWNCPQHITPRFTEAEISTAIRPMVDERNRLRAEIATLRADKDDR